VQFWLQDDALGRQGRGRAEGVVLTGGDALSCAVTKPHQSSSKSSFFSLNSFCENVLLMPRVIFVLYLMYNLVVEC
jgi:hypothetical protein